MRNTNDKDTLYNIVVDGYYIYELKYNKVWVFGLTDISDPWPVQSRALFSVLFDGLRELP